MPKTATHTPAIAHDRTPDNTPLPGGGAWTWDAKDGAWVETLPATPNTPAQE